MHRYLQICVENMCYKTFHFLPFQPLFLGIWGSLDNKIFDNMQTTLKQISKYILVTVTMS